MIAVVIQRILDFETSSLNAYALHIAIMNIQAGPHRKVMLEPVKKRTGVEEGYAGDNRTSEEIASHSTVPLVKISLMRCKADDAVWIIMENQPCG